MAFKLFGDFQDWREFQSFDKEIINKICLAVYKQHEAYYDASKALGSEYTWHSGIDGGERAYTTMLAEALHRKGYPVVAEFESDEKQLIKEGRRTRVARRICDLGFLKGGKEYVTEVKLIYLGLHRGESDIRTRIREAERSIRTQFNNIQRKAVRIGWIFGKVWEKVDKLQLEKASALANEAERRIRQIAKNEIDDRNRVTLFAWYKPWSEETRDQYAEEEKGKDYIEYDHGLCVFAYHILRGKSLPT